MLTVGLFMAQPGEPHSELGCKTQSEAFEKMARTFGIPKNSARNVRDVFDRFTASERVGWENAALPDRFSVVFDRYQKANHSDLRDLCLKILNMEWAPVGKGADHIPEEGTALTATAQFSEDVATNFQIPNFMITAESYATTWGFVNGKGRTFKLSNEDLLKALSEILSAWDAWTTARLNDNSQNPDNTLTNFAAHHFSAGAHQVLANDQRRGFLHFISAVVFTAANNAPFNEAASKVPLEKEAYEAALKIVTDIEVYSAQISQKNQLENANAGTKPPALKGGENVIFYGAPGTGKSKRVDQKISGAKSFRTVFHPDLQNSDFFGSLKPRMNGDDVRYEFAPGPFMQAMCAAYKTPDQFVYLVIEELNRAAAAAVFGDLFLLLDRTDGVGEYHVSFPSPESRDWFQAEAGEADDTLRLPSNLFIYATMNSADQGVYPIDTAFRRRWRQEYLPIDFSLGPDGNVAYVDVPGNVHTLSWRDFGRLLNEHLISSKTLEIAEDRLLGQWFVKKDDLNGSNVPEKVLLYLWDDLLRHEGREHIFDKSTVKTYGVLASQIKAGKRVLSDSFLAVLNAVSPVLAPMDAEENNEAV